MIDVKGMTEIASLSKGNWYKDTSTSIEGKYSISSLDQPISKIVPERMEQSLTDLSDDRKQELKEKGYGEKTVESIRSEEEADIYDGAELEAKEVNGRECLVRKDIDYDQVDDRGRTNLDRMSKGLSPLDKNGQPYELHHIGQKMDSPLAELTKKEHGTQERGNYTILHEAKKESEISRTEFGKERAEHWKARAEEVRQELENA
ncbi:hypothetical protein F975_00851 [Acinetobacter sp. ANC 3789]|uniref:HNH/ENDO VII family nuclease n=1 Tax=Acinetobacter sp. ANC 3789 TaxID=1217714 RepID=UPI0002CD7E70|nr:HNH/ENDO VII family nuclease [Acinetobacter sp. ANC 3789]ENU80993.1 hypothetical protein F975_00851 [Acinetobacter sp. ANC 3789]